MIDCQSRVVHKDDARYHGGERDLSSITTIVAHATAGDSFASSQEWLNRDMKTPEDHKASYNYGIDRDGTIIRALEVKYIAYHAGDSAWPNPRRYPPGNSGRSVNPISIGIAWANRDDGEPLTVQQIESGLWLFRFWMDRLHIPPSRVVGHYEVSPGRKPDPRAAIDMNHWRAMLAEA